MFGKASKGSAMCGVCWGVSLILAILGLLATLAAVIGVFKAHYPIPGEGWVFGSTAGSLSLLALAVNFFFLKKAMSMCPCQCNVK